MSDLSRRQMFLKIGLLFNGVVGVLLGDSDRALSSFARDPRPEGGLRKLDFAGLDRSVSIRRNAPGNVSQPGRKCLGWRDGGDPLLGASHRWESASRYSRSIARIWAVPCDGFRSRGFSCARATAELTTRTARAHPVRRSGACSNIRSRLSTGNFTSRRANCRRLVLPPRTRPLIQIKRAAMRLIRSIGKWLDQTAPARRADPRDHGAPDPARYRELVLRLRQRRDDGFRAAACHRNSSGADLCALGRRSLEQLADFESSGDASGWFIRALHGWGSNFMLAIVLIHMVQVFLFGAYKFPSELTWILGIFLLLMTLGMAFTGQVLRFDQDAYWGLGIGASISSRVPIVGPALVKLMLGGPIIAGATLSRFFALHVFVIPGLLMRSSGLHVLMVLKLGINEWPMPGRLVRRSDYMEKYHELTHTQGVPFVPYGVWKDAVFSGVILLLIAACALYFGPFGPSGQPDPRVIQTAPRPDYFFLWLYAASVAASAADWKLRCC